MPGHVGRETGMNERQGQDERADLVMHTVAQLPDSPEKNGDFRESHLQTKKWLLVVLHFWAPATEGPTLRQRHCSHDNLPVCLKV